MTVSWSNIDNVVAPEYDHHAEERQLRMNERRKLFASLSSIVSISLVMFVMGGALIVLPIWFPNGTVLSHSVFETY